MKMENGELATNGKENMAVFDPHFDHIFNNHCPLNPTILANIPHRPILHNIDSPITFDEVNDAINNKLKPGKASDLNGVPVEAYKAMDTETRQLAHGYVAAFFKGKEDYEGWHASQCIPVPKLGNSKQMAWCHDDGRLQQNLLLRHERLCLSTPGTPWNAISIWWNPNPRLSRWPLHPQDTSQRTQEPQLIIVCGICRPC
jgi:hypothetical protein